jgi:hypothetical protein
MRQFRIVGQRQREHPRFICKPSGTKTVKLNRDPEMYGIHDQKHRQ